MKFSKSLSVILLMYNEEKNISRVLDETIKFLKNSVSKWEILVIDDGSCDGGVKIIDEYIQKDPRIRLVKHKKNMGMGAGMRTGIGAAKMEYFVFNACDGQIAASELEKLFTVIDNGVDIALSTYANSRNNIVREILSKIFRIFIRLAAGINFKLEGLYLFPTSHAHKFVKTVKSDTFFFSFELIKKGLAQGLEIKNTKIRYRERLYGKSKVANFKRILKITREVLKYGRN